MEEMTSTIVFHGICTFVDRNQLGLGAGIRVVLLNASRSPAPGGVRIPPHFATIFAKGPDGILLEKTPINGAHFELKGGGGELQITTEFGQRVPNLTKLSEPVQPLGPPSPLIATGGVPDLVAAYFDIKFGTLTASFSEGGGPPVFSTLTVTHGTELPLTLEMTPFTGAPLTADRTQLTLPFQSEVHINNTSLDKAGATPLVDTSTNHFLLHYLVATQFPPAAQLPVISGGASTPGSMGCSNSTYP